MGQIVSNFFISLDGVVERPDQWHFPYFDDDMGAAVSAGMENADAMMMGRVLYDEWSDYWTKQDEDVPFSTFINTIPKYVVSSSDFEPTWTNTTVLSGDVAARVRAVKAATTGNIAISGSPTLVRWLLAEGLLDQLHLLLHPIAVGKGERLFQETPTYPLRLVSSTAFGSGVLHLVYAPAEESPPAHA